mmetsp:Transcript_53990/g.135709  ORF Transcript_53990/g.135709 Transcript_53990/m.135709 type:complete len:103 (-) Transcript_53990:1849-2157(-)
MNVHELSQTFFLSFFLSLTPHLRCQCMCVRVCASVGDANFVPTTDYIRCPSVHSTKYRRRQRSTNRQQNKKAHTRVLDKRHTRPPKETTHTGKSVTETPHTK